MAIFEVVKKYLTVYVAATNLHKKLSACKINYWKVFGNTQQRDS